MSESSDWFARAVHMRGFNAMYPHNEHLPSSERVIWVTDQPGNGLCVPKDKELSEWMMQNYGFDGVAYAYGEPDFEPFVETIRPADLMNEDFVRFRHEKCNREDPQVICDAVDGVHCQFSFDDTISTNRAANERACFDRIAEAMGGNVDRQVVDDYFSYKGLTCHEPSDLHTLQIIPTRINGEFKHTGGISTMRHSDQFMDTESEEAGVKVLRRSLDDSPRRAHDNPYDEVYDSFALPSDRPLTQEELDSAYRRDQVYVDGLQQIYGDGYAPRDNGVTADYATLERDLHDGYEMTSAALEARDAAQYVEGYDQYNEAHKQVNTDYYMTRMMQEQAVDQQYGVDPEYGEAQEQPAAQEQTADRLYGVDQEQEEAQEQSAAQEQTADQLYGVDQEQEEAQEQSAAQEQTADQLYGVDLEQSADRAYGSGPQQNEQRAPEMVTANEEPEQDMSNDMTY